jgi:hypothetical protein
MGARRAAAAVGMEQARMTMDIAKGLRQIAKKWEYTSETVAPGESWYDVLRKRGMEGWEAWHIEIRLQGYREIYFKRREVK